MFVSKKKKKNVKYRGKLKFVSMFIFHIIFAGECYQAYSLDVKNKNFDKGTILKV